MPDWIDSEYRGALRRALHGAIEDMEHAKELAAKPYSESATAMQALAHARGRASGLAKAIELLDETNATETIETQNPAKNDSGDIRRIRRRRWFGKVSLFGQKRTLDSRPG